MKYVNWVFGKNGALFSASASGKLEVASQLINEGADINATSPNGFTPLHRAAENGHKEIVDLLLSNGMNHNVKADDDSTPVSLARKNGHSDIVEILSNI